MLQSAMLACKVVSFRAYALWIVNQVFHGTMMTLLSGLLKTEGIMIAESKTRE